MQVQSCRFSILAVRTEAYGVRFPPWHKAIKIPDKSGIRALTLAIHTIRWSTAPYPILLWAGDYVPLGYFYPKKKRGLAGPHHCLCALSTYVTSFETCPSMETNPLQKDYVKTRWFYPLLCPQTAFAARP